MLNLRVANGAPELCRVLTLRFLGLVSDTIVATVLFVLEVVLAVALDDF